MRPWNWMVLLFAALPLLAVGSSALLQKAGVRSRTAMKASSFLLAVAFFAGTSGFSIYLSGYRAQLTVSPTVAEDTSALLHALYSTIRMFLGNDDTGLAFSGEQASLLVGLRAAVFWGVHVLASLVSFFALLLLFGKGLMRLIRFHLGRFKPYVHYIVGVTSQSLFLGESLLRQKGKMAGRVQVLYCDADVPERERTRIERMGAFLMDAPLLKDGEVQPGIFRSQGFRVDARLIRWIRQEVEAGRNSDACEESTRRRIIRRAVRIFPYRRKYRVYLFLEDPAGRLSMLKKLLRFFGSACLPVERMRLFVMIRNGDLSIDEIDRVRDLPQCRSIGVPRRNADKTGGTGSHDCPGGMRFRIQLFDEGELAADELFARRPMHAGMRFEGALLTHPYRIVLLGAGDVGAAMLRRTVIQSRFEAAGSEEGVEIVVLDHCATEIRNRLNLKMPELQRYGIRFVTADCLSDQLVRAVDPLQVDYWMIALGSDAVNLQTGGALLDWYRMNCDEGVGRRVIAVHVRDEDLRMAHHGADGSEAVYETIPPELTLFGAYQRLFSVEQMTGKEYRAKILKAVLLNRLYDLAWETFRITPSSSGDAAAGGRDAEAFRSLRATRCEAALKMIGLVREGADAEKLLDVCKSTEPEVMAFVLETFRRELDETCFDPDAPAFLKRTVQAWYSAFLQKSLFEQQSNLSVAEAVEAMVHLNESCADACAVDCLARREHARWNAFHHMHGWRGMNMEPEASGDAAAGLEQPVRMKFHKNERRKAHACLTRWESLQLVDKAEAVLRLRHFEDWIRISGKGDPDRRERVLREFEDALNGRSQLKAELLGPFGLLTEVPCYQRYDTLFAHAFGMIGQIRRMQANVRFLLLVGRNVDLRQLGRALAALHARTVGYAVITVESPLLPPSRNGRAWRREARRALRKHENTLAGVVMIPDASPAAGAARRCTVENLPVSFGDTGGSMHGRDLERMKLLESLRAELA